MTVYLDLVVLLNFVVDFLLILGTNRLSGFPPGVKRGALAAAFGAGYAMACLLPGFSFLGNAIWRMVSLCLMGTIAFGCDKSAVKRSGLLLLLSMSLGGVALAIGGGSISALIFAALLIWLLCRVGFGEAAGRTYVPVEIRHGESALKLLALQDTGNALRDPITGEAVLVLSADAAERLCGLKREELLHPMETMLKRPGFRLIPYHAVGQPGSMMLGLRLEQVKIGERKGSAIVAFAPEVIGKGDVYQALTGGAV